MDLAALLNRTYVFRDLAASELQPLVHVTVVRRYDAGVAVFRTGDPAGELCIVESGRIAYVLSSPDGGEFYAEVMWPGSVFGEPGLFAEERTRIVDAVAITETRLALIPRAPLIEFLVQHPIALLRVTEGLAADARVAWTTSAALVFSEVKARVVRRLVELVDRQGEEIDLGQSRLAALVGASRENVNRALRKLADEGAIRLDGRTIRVLNPEQLRESARLTSPLISGRNDRAPV